MQNIAKLKNKYTLIVVAHRLSTLKVCDRIYTLGEAGLIATDLNKNWLLVKLQPWQLGHEKHKKKNKCYQILFTKHG